MGEKWLDFYHQIKKEWKFAFTSTFLIGLLIHSYKFTNTLPNHDSLYNTYSTQNMIGSGRWFLSIACGFSSYFDLPWINGLFSILLIALAAVVIVDLFKVSNSVLIVIISGLLVSFPSITETFYFEFTADGYMLAMLLAVVSVRILSFDRKGWKNVLVAAICIALTCAIYQAYVSFALVLSICYLMWILLEDMYEIKAIYTWIGKQLIVYAGGLISYFLIWKLLEKLSNFTVTDYEGISQVGAITPLVLLQACFKMVKSFVKFMIEWNILRYGITAWNGLNILFILVTIGVCIVGVRNSKLVKRKPQFILFLLCIIAIPFAVYIWYFASPGVSYYPRMEQSICILYIFTALMCERWHKGKWSSLAAVLMLLIIINNGIIANVFYYYMNLSYMRGYAAAQEVATRIHMLDDGTIKQVAFVGERNGFADEDYKKVNVLGRLGPIKVVDYSLAINSNSMPLFLGTYMDFELTYYNVYKDGVVPLYKTTDSTLPISGGWELHFPSVDEKTQGSLEKSSEVAKMGVWPSTDSVKVMDDIVVVKFSE